MGYIFIFIELKGELNNKEIVQKERLPTTSQRSYSLAAKSISSDHTYASYRGTSIWTIDFDITTIYP